MKRYLSIFAIGVFLIVSAKLEARTMEVKDTVSYLIGYSSGSQVSGIPYDFDVESFLKGVQAALEKQPSGFEPEQVREILARWQKDLQAESSRKVLENKLKGKQFLEANLRDDPEVKQTRSGLQYKVVFEGQGKKPKASDHVLVHYTGRLINGDVFDSSLKGGEPVSFPLNGVIAGWTEGLQLMREGSRYMFYIPSELAYGDSDNGPIPAGSTLIFEVQLLEVNPGRK